MDLFISPKVEFEKVANEVTLPEDPNSWPTEILQELFKQVPYIADFEPHVVMDRVDAERAFGFGHVEVTNKTEIQHGASEAGLRAAGVQETKIPVIIKDGKLQPFDVIVTAKGEVVPLTESRLRQALFRPGAFDITGKTPGDMSMVGQLYPPYRQSGFGVGGMTVDAKQASAKVMDGPRVSDWLHVDHNWGKAAPPKFDSFRVKPHMIQDYDEKVHGPHPKGPRHWELHPTQDGTGVTWTQWDHDPREPHPTVKGASILSAILPTINEADYNGFYGRFEDRSLKAAFLKNAHATTNALTTLATYEPSTQKTAAALTNHIIPTVVQVVRVDDGYVVKTASHLAWAPVEKNVDRGQLIRALGEKVALAADMNGSVTVAEDGGAKALDTEDDKYELVSQFGIYKCRTEDGKEVIGYVFPNLLDVDGTPLPLALFTNGSVAAVQGEIAGVSVGGGANLFEGHPRGKGVFYEILPNGRAQATVPLTISASLQNNQEGGTVVLHGETFDGRPVEVSVQPNIQKITAAGEGSMLVPESMCWMPLDSAEEVVLVSAPDAATAATKEAAVKLEHRAWIRSSGEDSFVLSGEAFSKVASSFLSYDDALFLLGGAGCDLGYAGQKLAEAFTVSAPVEVVTKHSIEPLEVVWAQAKLAAAEHLSDFPALKQDLVKEAAVIPDPVAVDTVLSLGFINPENVGTFISYLPAIDTAQKKMCELLVAARLGLRDVPVSALEKAIRATEQVVEGLQVMAFQKN